MNDLDLLTSAEAAELLGITERTARDQMAKGALLGRKLGPVWVTTRGAVTAYRASSLGRPGRRPNPTPTPARSPRRSARKLAENA